MDTQTPLYPLAFEPIYKEKVWGGRALAKLGRTLPGGESLGIGESWELADLSTTSASGGGGSAEHSIVSNGPLARQSIRQLMANYGQQLLGPGVQPSSDGGFPLLVKFLDAQESLSVQVHPSPDYALQFSDAFLKSEAWYVVDARPGAVIYKGLTPGTTPEQLRDAIKANTNEAVLPLLNAVPVRQGDCHYLPSGTLHALGAGVVVAEVQTPSDTTFRVYDWGRTGRELHILQALACIDFNHADRQDDPLPQPDALGGFELDRKASCAYFHIDEVSCPGPAQAEIGIQAAELWIALAGDVALEDRHGQAVKAHPGTTLLLPASLQAVKLSSRSMAKLLRITMPRAAR